MLAAVRAVEVVWVAVEWLIQAIAEPALLGSVRILQAARSPKVQPGTSNDSFFQDYS
jgi:hypothetical protein